MPAEINLLCNGRRKIIRELIANQELRTADGTMSEAALSSNHAPITFQQEFALNYFNEAFFVLYRARLCGALNSDALSESVSALVQRHEALRSKIVVADMVLRQRVDAFNGFSLKIVRLVRSPAEDVDAVIQNQVAEFVDRWLRTAEVTFDALLIEVADDDHVLIVVWDHFFQDHLSGVNLVRELWTVYKNRILRGAEPPTPKSIQYRDYAVWQRREYPRWREQNSQYWTNRLCGVAPIKLPIESVADDLKSRLQSIEFSFGGPLSLALEGVARCQKIDLPIIVLAVIAIAISRWSGQRDFAMPFTFSGRCHAIHMGIMGYFINFVPLRITLSGEQVFASLFRCTSREFVSAIQHLDVGKIVDKELPGLVIGPYFQWFSKRPIVTAAMRPEPSVWDEGEQQLSIKLFAAKWQVPEERKDMFAFPMSLQCCKAAEGILAQGWYRADLFSNDSIQRFLRDLTLIAQYVVRDVDAPLSSLLS
ncbi:MAG: condensation domain-containing protein [Steroidobacteraceae bacterium]